MSRTNLKNMQRLIAEAAEAAVNKLAAERKIDADHIKEHAEASRVQIEHIAKQEQNIINYIEESHKALIDGLRNMFLQMRQEEQERLTALVAHLNDISTEEPPVIEHAQHRQLISDPKHLKSVS